MKTLIFLIGLFSAFPFSFFFFHLFLIISLIIAFENGPAVALSRPPDNLQNKMAALVRQFITVFKTCFVFLLVLYLYVTTFGLVLPWLCQNLGFSLFYNQASQSKERIERINELRTAKAYQTLSQMPKISDLTQGTLSTNTPKLKNNRLKIAFVIVSVQRPANPHYIVQVVARLLEQRIHKDHKITILDADSKSTVNEDISLLSEYVTVVNIQNGLRNASLDQVFEKERLDYISALQLGVIDNADYTIIIEDDALPDKNFLRNLSFVIKWKIPWLRSTPKWAFLKLYYPEKWQGFGNTEILELILIFIISGFLTTRFYIFLTKSKRSLVTVLFIFISSGGYFTILAYTFGRAHLIELGKFSAVFYRIIAAPSCCTPAVLYPKEHIKSLVLFLQSKTCSSSYPLDFALDDFVASQNLVKYLVSPNLVSHIGFHSSLNKVDKDIREFSLLFDP